MRNQPFFIDLHGKTLRSQVSILASECSVFSVRFMDDSAKVRPGDLEAQDTQAPSLDLETS